MMKGLILMKNVRNGTSNKITFKHILNLQDFLPMTFLNHKFLLNTKIYYIPKRKMSMIPIREKMKAWQTEEFTGIEGVHLSSLRIPHILKPSQVLVKVSASSVNPLDIVALGGYGKTIFEAMRTTDQYCMGNYFDSITPAFPLIVGRDFVGEVIRIGQAVSNVKVKDRVWGVVLPQQPGSHAEYVVTESLTVSHKPKSLSDIEAASIPYVGLTAWSTVVFTGGFVPKNCFEKHVLIIGASGGIGTFLSQLLNAWGAWVVGICSEDSFELVRSLGVSEVYDSKDDQALNDLCFHPRFDLIIDASGASNIEKWAGGLKEWKNAAYISLSSPLLKDADQYGLFMGFQKSFFKFLQTQSKTIREGRPYKWAFFMPNQTALEEIGKLVDDGKIRPVIDKVFKLEDAQLAYQHVKKGPRRGKTVIDFAS